MHFCVLAFLESGKTGMADIESQVNEIMEPYRSTEWDWFQLGGRWTGHFDGYDPSKDPKNIQTCSYCKGTGTRKDMVVANGCNACGGTGKEVLWPTQWKPRKGDILSVKKLTQEHLKGVYAMCCEGYGWLGGEEYLPWEEEPKSKFKKREQPTLAWLKKSYPNGVVVIVDCHN